MWIILLVTTESSGHHVHPGRRVRHHARGGRGGRPDDAAEAPRADQLARTLQQLEPGLHHPPLRRQGQSRSGWSFHSGDLILYVISPDVWWQSGRDVIGPREKALSESHDCCNRSSSLSPQPGKNTRQTLIDRTVNHSCFYETVKPMRCIMSNCNPSFSPSVKLNMLIWARREATIFYFHSDFIIRSKPFDLVHFGN